MIKVFVVEDEPAIQFLYKQMIQLSGFEVIGSADDGEMALKMFKSFENKPDIILMDHRMPKKNGLETAKEILALDNHTKIIFTSADDSIREQALLIGAASFKKKPFTIERLKANIEKTFHQKIVV